MELPTVILDYLDSLKPEQEERLLAEEVGFDYRGKRCLVMVAENLPREAVNWPQIARRREAMAFDTWYTSSRGDECVATIRDRIMANRLARQSASTPSGLPAVQATR